MGYGFDGISQFEHLENPGDQQGTRPVKSGDYDERRNDIKNAGVVSKKMEEIRGLKIGAYIEVDGKADKVAHLYAVGTAVLAVLDSGKQVVIDKDTKIVKG